MQRDTDRYYVTDPENGRSATRKLLERVLASAGGPMEGDDGRPIPATLASIYTSKVVNSEPLYISGQRSPVKRYIGRASKCASSKNPDENMWAILADISTAARQLTHEQKCVLTLRYMLDYNDYSIASARKLSLREVEDAAESGLQKLVSILDCTE